MNCESDLSNVSVVLDSIVLELYRTISSANRSILAGILMRAIPIVYILKRRGLRGLPCNSPK